VVAEAGASVLEGMPMGFVQVAADWRITYVNAAAEHAFGRRRADLLGRSAWQAFPGNEDSPLGRAYRRVASTRRPELFESWSAARGCWFEVRLVPAEGGRINAFFHDSTAQHRTQERLAVLARVSAELADSPDAVQTMSRIPRALVPVLADWAVVTVLDDDGRPRDVGCWHSDPELRPVLSRYAELRLGALPVTAPLVRSMHTQQTTPVTAAEVRDSLPPGEARDLQRRLATGGGRYLPLLGRGRTLGVITLWWQEGRTPDAEDLAAAREAAERIGLALDNGRLYRQQAALAEELQRSLLTRPVQPAGAEVAVRYTPAAEAARVGGDWYDAFRSPSGAMVLVIGDVVGHDTAAAAAMGQLRGLLRGIATYSDAGPGEVLRGLDAAMAQLALPTLATAAVARLEPDGAGGATMTWSGAGHLPPLVLGPDGSLADPSPWPGDLMLGVDCHVVRTEHRVALPAGSTVLLFTDGLVERRDHDLDTGLARLRATVAELAHRPLEELCDEVVDRIVHGRPDDDVALVAVRLA